MRKIFSALGVLFALSNPASSLSKRKKVCAGGKGEEGIRGAHSYNATGFNGRVSPLLLVNWMWPEFRISCAVAVEELQS